jgi:CheY-like chemotaxis protein
LKAVEHAKANSYDVIILDIMMPVMDGITALKKIREKAAIRLIF